MYVEWLIERQVGWWVGWKELRNNVAKYLGGLVDKMV